MESTDRPTASQLLDHSFVKQVKKCSHNNLISLIPNIKPLNSVQSLKNNINGGSSSSDENLVKLNDYDESRNDWNFS